jgi:hypothetical protein
MIVAGVNYNLPKRCPNATWNSRAITMGNVSVIGNSTRSVVVNKNNTVFAGNLDNRTIFIWNNGSSDSTRTIVTITGTLRSMFPMSNDGILGQSSTCPMIAINHWNLTGTSIRSYSIPYILGELRCTALRIRLTLCSMHILLLSLNPI